MWFSSENTGRKAASQTSVCDPCGESLENEVSLRSERSFLWAQRRRQEAHRQLPGEVLSPNIRELSGNIGEELALYDHFFSLLLSSAETKLVKTEEASSQWPLTSSPSSQCGLQTH